MDSSPVPPLDEVVPTPERDWASTPVQADDLWLYPLQADRVRDIDIPPLTIAAVATGLDSFLNAHKRDEVGLPETYANWDSEFGDTDTSNDPLYRGALATTPTGTNPVRVCLRSKLYRAAFRVLTGGGRYDADQYTTHDATRLFVIEGSDHAVVVAPTLVRPSDDPSQIADSATFTYTSTDDGHLRLF